MYVYPYNRPHSLQLMWSVLNELTLLQKKLQNIMVIKFWKKTYKTQEQQNKKANMKIIAIDGNWTMDLSHHCLGCFPSAT